MEIYDDTTLAAAVAAITNDTLLAMIERIVHDAKASKLWGLTCIVVIGPSDSDDELENILGFDPLTGPLGCDEDGQLEPWWSSVTKSEGFCELLHCVGDFAYYILVGEDGPSELATLCRGLASTLET